MKSEFSRDPKTYKNKNRNDLSIRIRLSDLDINQYYKPMIKLCIAYNESLYYFARADFHQNRFSMVLNRRSVVNKLIDIYKSHSNNADVLKIIGKDNTFIKKTTDYFNKKELFDKESNIIKNDVARHREFVRSLGREKVAFKFYYSEYVRLQEALDKVYNKIYLDDILQKLNDHLIIECSSKNLKDRADYYLTFDDMQIYNYLVAPIVGFHAILIALIFPPAGVGTVGILTATATSSAISIATSQIINLLKRTYNIIIRGHKYYYINKELLNENIYESGQIFDLYKIKEIISQLKQTFSTAGECSYFLANLFKYYAELKKYCMILSKDYIENNKEYDSVGFDKKYLFYKTMNYYRGKNILEETLKIQVDSIKLITSQSLLMLRGNDDLSQFIDKYLRKHKYVGTNSKVKSIILKLGGQSHLNEFKNLVMMTLNNEKINIHSSDTKMITLNPHSSIKDDILKFSDNFGGTVDFVYQVKSIFSNIPGTDAYLSKVFSEHSKALSEHSKVLDLGLWLSLNVLDGILYLSNNTSAIQKYQKISRYIQKISSPITLVNYTLGAVNLVCQNWAPLFLNSFITNFSLNPFSIFTHLLGKNIGKSVATNYHAIWTDICNEFEEYKKNYNKVPRAPAYDYFVDKKKCDPGETIHKLSNVFKDKLNSIINTTEKINKNSIDLIEKIKRFNAPSADPRIRLGINAFYAGTNINYVEDTSHIEDEILTDYIKIIFSLFSQAKDLESYDHYLNFLKDFDLEINNFLKLHFVILGVEDKGLFSVINFGLDLNQEIFSE